MTSNSAILAASQAEPVDVLPLLEPDYLAEVTSYTARQNRIALIDAGYQVRECLRYLYLVSANPVKLNGLFLPVEQTIDDVWHYLILQTSEYFSLCKERLPGKFFIQHRSVSYDLYQKEESRTQMAEQALCWIPLYCRTFGNFDLPAVKCWSMPRFLVNEMGMTLSDLSHLGITD